MFSIANPQDLICAALLRVSKPECVQNERHELVGYVHDKYKELSEDFDFKGICSETYQVQEFFRMYAEKISMKEGNVSWHLGLLKHAVYLDVIYIFA